MGKILLAGVGGNLGKNLKEYAEMGIETHVIDFNFYDNLENVFKNADVIGLISMPFIGKKRQAAHKNVVDAAKSVGVKKIVYTSLANAGDETNPSIEKMDHAFTENYIKSVGMDYIFLRNSQFAEAMVSCYFHFASINAPFVNNSGDGHMALISRKDCAKALAYALHKANEYDHTTFDINGKELLTFTEFVKIGNNVTGNNIVFKYVTDEETYKSLDAQSVPRTTDGIFIDNSVAPFCSDGIVSFGKAIRLEKFAVFIDDFKKLTGEDPIPVSYMFANPKDFEIGNRHSKDKK